MAGDLHEPEAPVGHLEGCRGLDPEHPYLRPLHPEHSNWRLQIRPRSVVSFNLKGPWLFMGNDEKLKKKHMQRI